ncbi:T9SS type A sorting domain-containing protein [Hymenobacter artigasi]|uniref:Delta-60 repeat protein n=1 Tax=Hymenobacter artigasi TaxID=2719616 RepID=A0ABX1HIR5_9BACT|nr:T9SS type A sorting domain-containing protein [Hymenobacter artigasi]NKI89985.1 putative delta-60 repeat protein [Hymenobacter artigasi]
MRLFYSFLAAVLLSCGSWLSAAAQQLDPSFAPSTLTAPGSGVFASLKQPDGKVLITGHFQLMNGQPSPRVARLNADGTPDLTFRAQAGSGPSANITALALQSDGKILLGGEYGVVGYNGTPVQNLIRLNADGSLDSSFSSGGTGWQSSVYSIAVQADGKIVVGGVLQATFNGQPTKGVIRLLPTGRLDTSFATGAGFTNGAGGYGEIRRIIAQPDGTIMVAGQFDAVDGQPCPGVARLSATGSRDASFNSPLVSYAFVFDMVRQPDGKLVLGGNTVTSSSNGANLVVRLLPTGALDPAFTRVAASGIVLGLGLRADGSILVTGSFSSFGGLNGTGLLRLNPTGTVDAAFAAGSQGNYGAVMRVVELNNGQYLAVGFFDSFGSQPSSGVARLLATGNVDTSYTMLLEMVASGLVIPQNNGQLVLNSYGLTTFNGQAVSTQGYYHFHRVNANGTYNALIALPPGTTRPNGSSYSYTAFPQPDGTFYTAYQHTDSTALVRRVLANGTFDAAFAAAELRWSRPYPFYSLGATITAHPGGGVLVTSLSTTVNGQPRRTLARLNADGTLNAQFAPPTNAAWQVPNMGVGNTAGFRYPVGLANGQTLVLWNDATRSYVDRFNLDGTIDNTFSIGTGGGLGSLFSIVAVAGGKIMVNGNFTTFNGQAAPYGLLRLLPSGAPDPGFTAASAAHTLAEQPDGKLLIMSPGTTSQTERLVRLTTTGSFDAGFQAVVVGNESFSPAAAAVYLQPGTNAIVLSGNFTSVAGQPRYGLARLVNVALATRAATAVPLAEAFPNPAHDQLTLRLPAAPTGPVLLADLQGRTVRRWALAQANGTVPLAGLAPGLYLLGIATTAGQSWQRIAIE